MKRLPNIIFLLIIIMKSFQVPISSVTPEDNHEKKNIFGAIIDSSCRAGREEITAMKIAIDDFCYYDHRSNTECPTLLVNEFLGSNNLEYHIETAFSASNMINHNHAKAILLGVETWHKALSVAKIGNESQVPILTLKNDQVPNWAHQHLPFLINGAPSQRVQMKAVAAIIRSWQWQRVNVIYEDIESVVTSVTPNLIKALQEVGSDITTLLPIPPYLVMSSNNMTSHLEILKHDLCRVYIVHTDSPTLAIEIFKAAKRLGLMEEDSVWITTTSLTNHIDSLGSSDIEAMQGVLGVKSYYLRTGKRYNNFRANFTARYALDYPHEPNLEPGTFAMQAYDAAFALSLALENQKPSKGEEILENILKIKFGGFFGNFYFNQSVLPQAHTFEIVNVAGKSYNELGFWTKGLGFSRDVHEERSHYNESMKILGQVVWPGRPWTIPRGWAFPGNGRELRIGVPNKTTFNEFVNIIHHADGSINVDGFSIKVFNRIIDILGHPWPYKFVLYNGSSYDQMVLQVQLEIFDAVVADTAIVADRCSYVQFSQPYTESGVQMIIYNQPVKLQKALLFQAPFTGYLWLATFFINIYNGVALYWVEREHNSEFREGSKWNQIGILFASAFKTLFSLQGPMLKNNSTRFAFVIWLFVCVVLIQTYTASLTALLTSHNRSPTLIDIQYLKRTGAKVGCDANSFVVNYLRDALKFDPKNIVKISSGDEYPEALEKGRIKAAFLEVPYVKLFTAKHCQKFVSSGPPSKVGGFGFAFSKNSPYLPDISKAILMASEEGTLVELEKTMYASYNCSSETPKGKKIGLGSFYVLFIVTGVATTFALLMHIKSIKQGNEDKATYNDQEPNDHDHGTPIIMAELSHEDHMDTDLQNSPIPTIDPELGLDDNDHNNIGETQAQAKASSAQVG